MANDINSTVNGQAFLEFELNLPGQTTPYTSAQGVPEIHKVTETVFGYNEVEIGFTTANPQFLDKILKALDANGEPLIRWRIGMGVGPNAKWIPWQLFYVYQYSAFFRGIGPNAGHYIKFTARDLLHKIDRASKTKAHRGKVSAIIKKLAAANGLNNVVIEDTEGEAVWIQSYEGDFEFARYRLLKRARNSKGRGNYYLYIRDNVLHFHTVEYQTSLLGFNYYQSPRTKLEAIDLAQANINDGSAGVRVIYHDPYSGRSKEIRSDPDQAIRLANSLPRLDKIAGAERNMREHKISTQDETSGPNALAQNAYEYARSECFALKLQTSATFYIRPGQLMRINIEPSAGNTSTWSGLYLVATASHVIENNALNSVYILQRGEQQVARTTNNAQATYGVDTLTDSANAPGHDINLREAQSSSLVKGAGKEATGGAYLTVQNKSAAPDPTATKPQSQSGF